MYIMNRPSICVVGSLNVDLVVTLDRFHLPGETVRGVNYHTFPGGKGGNQAIAAARLGADVRMIGCLGEDANAALYRAVLDGARVDARYVFAEPDAPTGVALIEVDASGENRIAVVRGANDALTPDRVTDARHAIEAGGYLLAQLEVPLESVLRAARLAREVGARVIFDPAPAPVTPVPDELLSLCDYLTPNEHELRALTGLPAEGEAQAIDACTILIRRGAKAVVNKRGAKGALLVTADGARAIPAFSVNAVDTTAAGDTFNAAFAVRLSMKYPAEEAIRFANAAAALSTTAMGAQSAMPDFVGALALMEAM